MRQHTSIPLNGSAATASEDCLRTIRELIEPELVRATPSPLHRHSALAQTTNLSAYPIPIPFPPQFGHVREKILADALQPHFFV